MSTYLPGSYPGETNGLVDPEAYHASVTHKIERSVPWTAKGLRVTRLRLVSDPGFPCWDVSYCHGRIGDEPVNVELPFNQLPKHRIAETILKWAKKDGVFATGIGVFNAISTLI
jgi:hypothetical protein